MKSTPSVWRLEENLYTSRGTINFSIITLLFAGEVQSGKYYKEHRAQHLPPEQEQKGNSLQLSL